MGFRPANAVARGVGGGSSAGTGVEKKFLPAPTEVEFDVPGEEVEVEGAVYVDSIAQQIDSEIRQLEIPWKYLPARRTGMLLSREGDVWSRKARRKKLHHHTKAAPVPAPDEKMRDVDVDVDSHSDSEIEAEPALVARLTLSTATSEGGSGGGRDRERERGKASEHIHIHIRHLQGHDPVLFESLCGWLKRKVCRSGPDRTMT
jgi:hypothetical protein